MLRDTFAIWWRLRTGDAYGSSRPTRADPT
jgi:hypothetical protein